MTAFEAPQLDAIRSARTVRIRTSPGADRQPREAIIWIVVDEAGRVEATLELRPATGE